MKSKSTFSIILLAILFASCTTAYKSGQTPDDVYYSPARPQGEYVRTERQDDSRYRYQDDEAYRDDRYLRMKIRDRRYSGLYDDYYSYNPYYYHYYNGRLIYNSPWSSYNYWNYYYNPYYYAPVISVVPRTPIYNKPRTFDLGVYNPQPVNNNPKGVRNAYATPDYNTGNNNNNSNNYRNSGRDAGGFLRDVFSGSSNSNNSSNNNSSNSSNSSNTRSSSSSSSSSSNSSSSGSSSNAPARRF
ncbi:MAG: hypothetical protein J7502_08780 [Flavisolibacter sp.]|nr:hypothetical protein [Flavisolibacter sp.]